MELMRYYDPIAENIINYQSDNYLYYHQGHAAEIIKEVVRAGFILLNEKIVKREVEGNC